MVRAVVVSGIPAWRAVSSANSEQSPDPPGACAEGVGHGRWGARLAAALGASV